MPVAQVEMRDGLLLNLLLLDQLLDGRDDRGGGRQVRLGLVEPSLNAITEGNLLLRHSQGWEKREELDETHDAKKQPRRVRSTADQARKSGESGGDEWRILT